MPRNGSNVYSKAAGTTAVSGTTISSTDYNATIDDLVVDANVARALSVGGTGATNPSAARLNLGLEIGVDIALYDGPKFDDATALIADTAMSYSTVTAGDIVQTRDGYSFEVLDVSATGDIQNANATPVQMKTLNNIFGSWDLVRSSITGGLNTITFQARLFNYSGDDAVHVVRVVRDDTLTEATSCVTSADGFHYGPDGGMSTPLSYGAAGGKAAGLPLDVVGIPLSDRFATLGDAQAVYPKATNITDTIDDHAFQKAIDAQRNNVVYGVGDQEINKPTGNNTDKAISYVIPRGSFYISRSLDFTNIRDRQGRWSLHFDSAVIVSTTVGKATMDLSDSRACAFSGVGTIIGKWTSAGVPRVGILIGRVGPNTLPADSHNFSTANLSIKGRFSLGCILNSASEGTDLGFSFFKNDLNHYVEHMSFDGSDGVKVFAAAEPVTWTGGTGIVAKNTNDLITGKIAIRVLTGALADNTVITGTTSTKVATVNGTPVAEPAGEGPDGRSYVVVNDGSNKWGIQSDYQAEPALSVGASFLDNKCKGDLRHTGYGDALWTCSRATNHNFDGTYMVASDNDCAVVTVYFDTTTKFKNFSWRGHGETDEGDMDASTGMGYSFNFEAATAATNATVIGLNYRDNNCHASKAAFFAGTNIAAISMIGADIDIYDLGRDVGQVMFSDPAKFGVHGSVSSQETNNTFMNISGLASMNGTVLTNSITKSSVQLLGSDYWLSSPTASTFFGNLNPALNSTSYLGSSSKGLWKIYAARTQVSTRLDGNAKKVLGTQQAAIADAAGLNEVATINSILAALRAHGIIAT